MLLHNVTIATMASDQGFGLIENGAVVLNDKKIEWCGEYNNLPDIQKTSNRIDLAGRLITPSFIDCHTHIIHGGNRAKEFEMRLSGASYEEVARNGGGIVSTVTATRAASLDDLIKTALPRVDALIAEGVTTIEIKSGYGLDIDTELQMLRAARAIEKMRYIRVKTSFLGAHAVPSEYSGDADGYISKVCIPALEKAHAEGLVDTVDGFCESIAFTSDQIERVFKKALDLGLPVKLHAEQLSNSGGTQLATRYGALSVDHVEYASSVDVKAMAKSGTTAVLLPGAFYTLHETQMPPISDFRNNGVPMALATDCNPGSSPMTSLLLTMNMGCTLFRLTPAEALAGVTRNAARALRVLDSGMIKENYCADMAIWNVEHPAELSYRIGFNPLHARIYAGECMELLK